jgi:hypothetical protein
MSKSTYLLKLPISVKAAARLAKAKGVSLNQFVASAVAEMVGVIETARGFLERRAGHAKPNDLLKYPRKAGREWPGDSDRRDEIQARPMATFSADTASPRPPSPTPAGPRASSRHASRVPRTTSARGPLAWGAPRTRTHRSIPAPPTPAGALRRP